MSRRPARSFVLTLLVALVGFVLATSSVAAADQPLERVVEAETSFDRLGVYVLEVDGEAADDARFYQADGPSGGILVVTSTLPRAALLRPQTKEVFTLAEGDLPDERDDASLRITPELRWRADGIDRPKERRPGFVVDGAWATIDLAEPRIGTFDYAALEKELPLYVRRSTRHAVDADSVDALVAALRGAPEPRRLEVYFGSTCGRCARLLPGFLAVERAVGEAMSGAASTPSSDAPAAPFEIVYHGIAVGPDAPRELIEDLGIDLLPTAILRDASSGREIGRLDAAAWDRPAAGLLELVTDSAPTG